MANKIEIFKSFSNNLPLGIFTFDKRFKILSWNTYLEKKTGILGSTAIHMFLSDLVSDWTPKKEEKLKGLFIGRSPFSEKITLEIHQKRIVATFNFDRIIEKDKIIAGMGSMIFEDVDIQSEIDNEENILDVLIDGIITINSDQIITYFNETASLILNTPAESVLGKNIFEAFPGINDTEFETNFRYVIDTQESKTFESFYSPLSSWYEINALPFKGGVIIYFRTITDKKIIEERLLDAEVKYKNIISQTQDGIVIIDKWGKITEWNTAIELMTGTTSDDVIGKRLPEVMSILKVKSLDNIDPHVFLSEVYDKNFLSEWKGLLAEWELEVNGQKKIHQAGISRIDFDNDYIFVIVLRDVTQQKAIRDELIKSNENLEITLNSIGDGVITTDNKGYITRLNPVAENLTGWKNEEAIGKYISDVLKITNPRSTSSPNNPILKVLETGKKAELAVGSRLVSKNKRVYHIADSAAPIKKDNGEIVGIVMVFRDISKEYANEVRIKEMEERFRVAFKTSPDAIAITRVTDGVFIDANDGFTRISGYLTHELLGKSILNLNIWKNNEDRQKLIETIISHGHVDNYEAKFVLRNKTEITGLLSARIIILNNERYLLSITRDITSRIKIEEELKASESRFKYILKHDPSGIAIFDRDLKYLMVSDRYLIDARLVGQDVIGKSYFDFFPNLPEKYKKIFRKCLKGAIEKRAVDYYLKSNGEKEFFKWEIRPWHTSSGEIGGIVLYMEIITDRIKAEISLKERNEYIENILAHMPIGIVALKPGTGDINYVNPYCLEAFDLKKNKIKKIQDILSVSMLAIPEYESGLIDLLQNNFSTINQVIHWEAVEIITKLKKRKSIAIYNIPLPEQDMVVLAIQDITSRKKAEEERDRLFNFSIDMLFVAGFDGFFKQLNPAWEKTLGWTQTELTSKPWLSFIANEDQMETRLAQTKLEQGKSIILFENRFQCKDRKYKWLSWNAIPLTDQNLVFGVVRDISAQKQTEEELMLRNSELNNFVYKVSHDLRAPLSSIRGLVSLMKIELPVLAEHNYIKLIENRIIKLDNFIRDILSHSKNLNTEINISKIDFNEVIENCFAELAYLENSSRIYRHVQISGIDFYNDHIRIYEIFRNLISNSIKYLNPYLNYNYITIVVNINKYHAVITIEDNGIGIPEEMQPRIFEMFFKGSDKSDSSGIGLYIVQQAVKKLDGTIEVESESNKGSKFKILLPNRNP